MATTTHSLRLLLRPCRRAPAFQAANSQATTPRRYLSTTPPWRKDGEEGAGRPPNTAREARIQELIDKASTLDATVFQEQMGRAMGLSPEEMDKLRPFLQDARNTVAFASRPYRARRTDFWNDANNPYINMPETSEEDVFQGDDMLSMGHDKLEEHREHREYARIAVWEMPLLAKFAKPFVAPEEDQVLRFRYTTYMGEFHPGEKKVVVEFCPMDLGLTEVQQSKLLKIVGVRYNPEKEIIRMSCSKFEHQAQNKRYLGDLVEKLIVAAKDPTDTFEDIPLDTRHHKVKVKPHFPKEWLMTEERRAELQKIWDASKLLDESKKAGGAALADGEPQTTHQLPSPEPALDEKVAELVRVPVGNSSGPGAPRGRL